MHDVFLNARIALPFCTLWVLLILTNCVKADTDGTSLTPTRPVSGSMSIVLENSSFDPEFLLFDQGETVRFLLHSVDEIHTFTVGDLDIDWSVPKSSMPIEKEFTFNQPGRFEIVCMIYGHEGDGMIGEIVVE